MHLTHITVNLLVMLPAVLQLFFHDSGKFRSMNKRYCFRTENRNAASIMAGYQYTWQEPTDRFLPSTLTTDCLEATVLLLL